MAAHRDFAVQARLDNPLNSAAFIVEPIHVGVEEVERNEADSAVGTWG